MKPILFGCSGPALTTEEHAFFKAAKPFGFILFKRNCEKPAQIKKLVKYLRESVDNPNAPVFIDQEGGRVARLTPPHWPKLPALRVIGRLYEENPKRGLEAIKLHSRLTARRLTDLGINGNCAPVLDLFIDGASSAIGDRALSRDPKAVIALGRAAVETYLEHGILPVIKHIPGHGRVTADPHETLPTVTTSRLELQAEDFVPFRGLKDAPIAMNCHVVFKALDPDNPVSLSRKIHKEVIRGYIGFEGLVFSDDLAMKALSGPLPQLAARALEAGADVVLHCTGILPEMQAIAESLPEISEIGAKRAQKALERCKNEQISTSEIADSRRLASLLH